jgi:type IV secretory pathway TrbD component
LLVNLLRRGGSLLASALVLFAAAASLFGPAPVQRLVNSWWYLAGAGITTFTALLAAVIAVPHRSWSSAIQHLGLVVALVGVFVNQKAARSGYLFLEQGAGPSNVCLSRDLRLVEELPQPLALDSLTMVDARAFLPAPVVWVTAGDITSTPVTYNHPLKVSGRQLLITQVTSPGFLTEYEVAVDGTEYLLLHNQVTEPSPGFALASFGYDAEAARVGLAIDREQYWLGIGESTRFQGRKVKLLSAAFAGSMGAIFVVNDVRYRFILFVGFGLVLLGLLPSLFRRETP